ncbi:hypothetical protein K474DRAFT_1607005 [Panus rudis PR-1116 ss-1]|nr:hypothetical protein K474DRAFT_1607005 [Panus rudis PR-1116 ss-1]
MEHTLWNKVPESTNAEEAMHFKMYKALGNQCHDLLPGMKRLYAFAHTFYRKAIARSSKSAVISNHYLY